jgi:hypothetical protein
MGVEVNADKINFNVMSRDQNAVRIHNMTIGNRSFEMMEEFQSLGTTITNQILFKKKLRAD